jgi:hypothetical protein
MASEITSSSPLDNMRGRGHVVFLGTDLSPEACSSLLDTAYDDKLMSARIMRVAVKCGTYVDDRSRVTYNAITRGFDVTVWEWPRSRKHARTDFGPDRILEDQPFGMIMDSIFEPYHYVTEE